jgi:hypothetical protein
LRKGENKQQEQEGARLSGIAATCPPWTPELGYSARNERAESGELPDALVVAVSAEEKARGALLPQTERAARAAFSQHGFVLLRGVFAPALIEAMYRDYLTHYGAISLREMQERAKQPPPNRFVYRGEARYQITPPMANAFGAPEIYANGLVRQVLAGPFDNDLQLNSFTLVVSYPGSTFQPVHRDHAHLFAKPDVAPLLPVYAVNAVVPLMDTDLAAGPTGLWPGSHLWPDAIEARPESVVAGRLRRGDCMLLDYRTLHSGLANRSTVARPIACMVYARSWFFDDVNYYGTTSLDLPLEEQEKVPDYARPLLARARSQTMRIRSGGDWGGAPPVRAADPIVRGKVGRNDPCPCGSGRKFKQCHGR